jgi:hypothetical protein
MGSHYLYGLRLAAVAFRLPYVATLEDDLVPAADFLELHAGLARHAARDAGLLAVAAYPGGPEHDCRHVAAKLRGRGPCRADDPARLVRARYFTGWGAGLPRRVLWLLLPGWGFQEMVYDEVLAQVGPHHRFRRSAHGDYGLGRQCPAE